LFIFAACIALVLMSDKDTGDSLFPTLPSLFEKFLNELVNFVELQNKTCESSIQSP
jgi:hypothetical protein